MVTTRRIDMVLSDDLILKVITDYGAQALTHQEIAAHAKCGTATVWRSLQRLEKENRIVRSKHGRNGTQYKLPHADD